MFDGARKILMTADTVGGVWTYCMELARSAEWKSVSICLATMGAKLSRSQSAEAAALENLEVVESGYKLEWMEEPWSEVEAAGEWLLELEDRFEPDIVHLNGYAHGALPFKAPKVVVAHSCVLSWWEAVKGVAAPSQWDLYREYVLGGLRDADAIVGPSAAMLENIERLYGPSENSRVIYNGCDAHAFGRTRKEPFILAAGRLWDEAKNIGALASVSDSVPWPICVAGDNQGPQCKEKIEPGPGITCLGKLHRSELAKWYSRASIYALPARYEPFGLSVLEAALSGCALVLADIASLRELWDGAAVFVNPNDSAELEGALQRLIADPDGIRALSQAAEIRARSYTISRMAAAYLELYQSLMFNPATQTKELASCA
jgi:glycogen synthase